MELQSVSNSAAAFHTLTKAQQELSLKKMRIAMRHLDDKLPTLDPDQKAAVAWVITIMMSTILHATIDDISVLITDTGISYALAACKLHGLIPEAGDEL